MKLLVAVDFSPPTERILQVATDLAKSLKAQVWLVHVAEPDPDFIGYEAGPEVVRDQVAAEFKGEHKRLQQYADALRAEGVETTALLVQGATVETLLKLADEQKADMVIVGSHGRSMVANLVVGSVSAGLIKGAGCPVTIVPVGQLNS